MTLAQTEGVGKRVAEQELDAVEYIILETIHRNGNVNDYTLANQLRCTRSFLLSKLEHLLKENYLAHTPEGYTVSEKGRNARIPLHFWENQTESPAMQAESAESYDWTALYVPPVGWTD